MLDLLESVIDTLTDIALNLNGGWNRDTLSQPSDNSENACLYWWCNFTIPMLNELSFSLKDRFVKDKRV